jgi:predicted ATPase
MNVRMSERFKSIHDFTWNEIPLLSVITGPNGSGKTHLLELLHHSLVESNRNSNPSQGTATITGISLAPTDVVYVPDTWRPLTEPAEVTLATLQQHAEHLWEMVSRHNSRGSRRPDPAIIERLEHHLNKKASDITREDIIERGGFRTFRLTQDPFHHQLSEIFHDYFIHYVQFVEREKVPEADFVARFGPPPWQLLKEILEESKLPFTFEPPPRLRLWEGYKFSLIHTLHKIPIRLSDLSSGEKVLFSLVLWLFSSGNKGHFPRLLLLDEPDAHLHPSMCKRFLDTIANVLVHGHSVRVIMTTHSPSTVALSPTDSLFELTPPGPKIERIAFREQAIARLTAGFVTVMKTTRHVFVEDEEDREFYEAVFQMCVDDGHLDKTVPLVFLPASSPTRSGAKGQGGGWAEVKKIIERLSDTALKDVVCGLLDGDGMSSTEKPKIYRLTRYSIENYLMDPFVVYGALLEMQYPGLPQSIKIKYGQEHLLRLDGAPLQPIVDWVGHEMGVDLNDREPTAYMPRGKVELPRAFAGEPGKTLLSTAHGCFGGNYVNRSALARAFARVRLIPADLVETLRDVQAQTA